jgi:hypothetical protein
VGFKGSNWTRGELGHERPTKEEVAGDLAKEYKDDDRSLEELIERKKHLEEGLEEDRIRREAKKEVVDEVIEDLDQLPDTAKNLAERRSKNDGEREDINWKHAITRLKQKLEQGRRTLRRPGKDAEELKEIEGLIVGGKIVEEGKDADEVFSGKDSSDKTGRGENQ